MTSPDKSTWVTSTRDEMDFEIDDILLAAGFKEYHMRFSIYETTQDPLMVDMSDWLVKHPDFASRFAEGKVQFILGEGENDQVVLSRVYVNPTWADVLVVAEMSCIGRGAPELDHVFLESVDPEGPRSKGVQRYTFWWGS